MLGSSVLDKNINKSLFFFSSEVKAGTDSIFMVRSPMAKCSAISCDVSVVVWSEYEVNDQWVIFKNGTAMVS